MPTRRGLHRPGTSAARKPHHVRPPRHRCRGAPGPCEALPHRRSASTARRRRPSCAGPPHSPEGLPRYRGDAEALAARGPKARARSKCLIQSMSVSRDPQQATTLLFLLAPCGLGDPGVRRLRGGGVGGVASSLDFRHRPADPLSNVLSAPASADSRFERFPHKTTGKVDRRGGEDRRPMGPPTAPSRGASVACAGR